MYVFKEYPKWVNGKIVKNAEEEAALRPPPAGSVQVGDTVVLGDVSHAVTAEVPAKRKYTRKA